MPWERRTRGLMVQGAVVLAVALLVSAVLGGPRANEEAAGAGVVLGKWAERRGAKVTAIEEYHWVVWEHPDTPVAKVARARIRALTGKGPRVPAADRAARMLDTATRVEAAGEPDEALHWFVRLVQEHRKSPEAKVAAGHIRDISKVQSARYDPKKFSDFDTAASILDAGKYVERLGEVDNALRQYRRLVDDFTLTPEAGEAARRIKALAPKKKAS